MVVGYHLYKVRTLFTFASKFAHNRFIHSSQVSVSVTTRKNKNIFWNDAGSLQLATNGICVIDAEKVSEKDRCDLVSILDQNRYSVKVDDNQSSKEETLKVAVWVSQSLKAFEQSARTRQPIPVDLFPLVIKCQDEGTVRDSSPLSTEDWSDFFTLSSRSSLAFTKEARDILKDYFLTARTRLRNECDPKILSHLMTSSRALAKLCLRQHVLTFDAILAISLFEESCLIKYSKSALDGTDFPRFERLAQMLQEPEVRAGG